MDSISGNNLRATQSGQSQCPESYLAVWAFQFDAASEKEFKDILIWNKNQIPH